MSMYCVAEISTEVDITSYPWRVTVQSYCASCVNNNAATCLFEVWTWQVANSYSFHLVQTYCPLFHLKTFPDFTKWSRTSTRTHTHTQWKHSLIPVEYVLMAHRTNKELRQRKCSCIWIVLMLKIHPLHIEETQQALNYVCDSWAWSQLSENRSFLWTVNK